MALSHHWWRSRKQSSEFYHFKSVFFTYKVVVVLNDFQEAVKGRMDEGRNCIEVDPTLSDILGG